MEVGKLIQRCKEEYDQERKALEGKTTYDFSHLDQNRKKMQHLHLLQPP